MIQGELSFFETTVFFQTLMYWKLLPSLKILQFSFFSTTLTPILNKPKQIDGLVIVHYQGHTNMIVDGGRDQVTVIMKEDTATKDLERRAVSGQLWKHLTLFNYFK